jgi:hypothetical protein
LLPVGLAKLIKPASKPIPKRKKGEKRHATQSHRKMLK